MTDYQIERAAERCAEEVSRLVPMRSEQVYDEMCASIDDAIRAYLSAPAFADPL